MYNRTSRVSQSTLNVSVPGHLLCGGQGPKVPEVSGGTLKTVVRSNFWSPEGKRDPKKQRKTKDTRSGVCFLVWVGR